jgi:FixJ family two-component response regulator
MASDDVDALVIVIDNDPVALLQTVCALQAMHVTVESFASAEAFLRCPLRDMPTCVVLDVSLPGLSGLALQEVVAASGISIIFLTGDGDIPMAVRAMKAGAVAFLTKPCTLQDLHTAVGEGLAHACLAHHQRAVVAPLHALYARLTPRECEVMGRVVAGQLNKQIAAALGVIE